MSGIITLYRRLFLVVYISFLYLAMRAYMILGRRYLAGILASAIIISIAFAMRKRYWGVYFQLTVSVYLLMLLLHLILTLRFFRLRLPPDLEIIGRTLLLLNIPLLMLTVRIIALRLRSKLH